MARKFRILHIGKLSIENEFINRKDISIDFLDSRVFENESIDFEEVLTFIEQQKAYNFVFVEYEYKEKLKRLLMKIIEPFNTYISMEYYGASFIHDDELQKYFIRPISAENRQKLIEKVKSLCFSGQYGDKKGPGQIKIHPNFKEQHEYLGNRWLKLSGEFGNHYQQIAMLDDLLYYEKEKALEIWPEYKKVGNVSIEITFRIYSSGTVDDIIKTITVNEDHLKEPIIIESMPEDAFISYSVKAKGTGELYLGAIHRRWSRLEFGKFLLGGEIFKDDERNEFIYIFNPGDMKPPLNVYFSGYRSAEGFEGYFMMQKLGAPFLLIGDPRIEGGSFYVGSEAYEQGIQSVINDKLAYLGFKDDDLILSGLSMGSFGAIYYGAKLNPAAVIVGKPLVNIGTIGQNMKLLRPEEFGTSLDVLLEVTGGNTDEHVLRLNQKFWDTFNKNDISRTTFAICYMEDDDYDLYAFNELLDVLSENRARVLSRGVPGRHNDDSPTINNWFINFYRILLEMKFGRSK
ncbi:accessory Sec system protein Asp2 [Macrococcoides bohemicum]|uniref:Accessory Sec system protein Asp2 n=1 Tax=Macrococcoides bohemicum TaxID=1903056 RepID=A0A328A520_9STAP|nr:accessory Sec system protein Asp2 [Macrococcus bohemicus]QRN50741.1 accessory Sec system protein Asp2 [Macrococcus bohemicus]RAK48558.1 accessory Sec system protein Asp2 [Macrococcus bohemicus]